jgi:uncharacterized membrane protein YeaQ/YmgE (transglycosylase-associated protein family)
MGGIWAWIVFLAIGLAAGWLASLIVKGRGSGLLVNLVVGVIGAFLGGWLFRQLSIPAGSGFWGSLLVALVGAVILLFLLRLIKKL